MPKKSTKSKSKRMTLRKKFKIIKKVREHHKKKRKELKKSGKSTVNKKLKAVLKDPGIPMAFPFKEQFMKEMEFEKKRIEAKQELKKQQNLLKSKQMQGTSGGMDVDEDDRDKLQAAVQASETKQDGLTLEQNTSLHNQEEDDPDHSRRTFYREFKKVVDMSDVILLVLDARDPAACRCAAAETYVKQQGPNKRLVLLLNKIDLIPRESAEAWLAYLKRDLPTLAFKASTQQQASRLSTRPTRKSSKKSGSTSSITSASTSTSACLGADTLLALLKNYARSRDIKTTITVGVIGMPNVGKSSVINSLKRARVANVGNMPGVTRSLQEIRLDKHIKLMDCPGIVFGGNDAEGDVAGNALRNAVRVDRLPDPVGVVEAVVNKVGHDTLAILYGVSRFSGAGELLGQLCVQWGRLKKGGVPDLEAAAKVVIQDWNDGKIPFYTMPATRRTTTANDSQIVTTWAQELDLDSLSNQQSTAVLSALPSVNPSDSVPAVSGAISAPEVGFIATRSAGPVPGTFLEEPAAGSTSTAADVDMEGPVSEDPRAMNPHRSLVGKLKAGVSAQQKTKVLAKELHKSNLEVYDVEGMRNAPLERAQRKRAKKAKAKGRQAEDYDFASDYVGGMNVGEG